MAVTRLKRKEAKNRSRAQVRVANLKRLNHKHNIPSPYKGESGIVLEDQEEVKTEEVKPQAVKEEAPAAEEVKEETSEKDEKKDTKEGE